MFVKWLVPTMLALSAATPVKQPSPADATADPAILMQECAGREGWSDPAPPARVFGNTYMVGTCGIVSLLVTTPEGHFLIDGATQEAAPLIAENIRKLGFDPKDVRYILSTHEHLDHVGGLAELKRITGAKFVTRAEAKTAMESGLPDPTDPQLGSIPGFEGIKADMLLKDGRKLRIGKQALTLIATPGHTPGGTSWAWMECEGKSCHRIVYADSLSAVSAPSYRFIDHFDYVRVLNSSIDRIGLLSKCDILITPHPSRSAFFERLSGKNKLVNPAGCKTYAASARVGLAARIAEERVKENPQ